MQTVGTLGFCFPQAPAVCLEPTMAETAAHVQICPESWTPILCPAWTFSTWSNSVSRPWERRRSSSGRSRLTGLFGRAEIEQRLERWAGPVEKERKNKAMGQHSMCGGYWRGSLRYEGNGWCVRHTVRMQWNFFTWTSEWKHSLHRVWSYLS